jgi:MarR family transcriptional regulator for hemolysin
VVVTNGPRPFLRRRPGDRRRDYVSRNQRDLSVSALLTFDFILKETALYVQRFEQRAGPLGATLPQCKVLAYLANYEGVSQVRLAELTNLKPMTLVRCLDRLESWGCLERRRDLADRRAHRIYLKAAGKPLADELWRLVNVTRREALAGIPRKSGELMIELLEKIQTQLRLATTAR